LFSNTDIAVLFLDSQCRIKRFTPATVKLFNLILTDVGRPIGDIAHRLQNLNLQQDAETLLTNLMPIEKEVYTDNGEYFVLRILSFRTDDNKIDGIVATFVDVSHLKQAEKSLARSKERVELLLKSTGEAIYGVDEEGRCIFVNNKCLEQLGFTEDELLGNNPHPLIQHTRRDGSRYPWEESFVCRCLKKGISYRGNHDVTWRKDGTSFPALYTAETIVEDGRVTGTVVIFRDMTEADALSSKLNHLARHDPLTGLVNRRGFEERLEQVLERTQRNHTKHALCYLDLDQFKVINDTCGHVAGDQLLRQIGGILSQSVRKRDLIARLGGDEFGVLMENCDVYGAELSAKTIRDAVADYRFQWEDKTHVIGVSIGIVSITEDAGSLIDVLKAADAACYAAKESGRNRFHVYHEQDTALATRHGEMQWVARLNRALEENRLLLALQPIAPIHDLSGENVSYEILLRMQEADGTIIPPADFLGAAERYNLSIKVDRWVISNFFKWKATNKRKLEQVPLFNINLSGQSLGDEDFLNFTIAEFEKYQVSPEKICFEITETAAITNLASATRFIQVIKQLGCLFALDDFGTGLSSFGYLKTLPVEYLKISGLFVKDITDDAIDLAMVKSINEIGQVMGKKTIAESVENEGILVKLRELGVDYAQGYFIGKPVLLDDMTFTKK
jgi:two-component system CheB/CheR fusion protein